MRNMALSLILVAVIVGSIGYGASHLTQDLGELKTRLGELKQAQATFKSQVSELRKLCDDMASRLSALSKPEGTEDGPAKELKSLNEEVARLKADLVTLSSKTVSPPTETNQQEIGPELIEARKQRCQYVQEYLVKLEEIFNTKEPEARTEKRTELDKEYHYTREFLLNNLGKAWVESYEDALQAAYLAEDPVMNIAGKAKIKPLFGKVLQKCMEVGP